MILQGDSAAIPQWLAIVSLIFGLISTPAAGLFAYFINRRHNRLVLQTEERQNKLAENAAKNTETETIDLAIAKYEKLSEERIKWGEEKSELKAKILLLEFQVKSEQGAKKEANAQNSRMLDEIVLLRAEVITFKEHSERCDVELAQAKTDIAQMRNELKTLTARVCSQEKENENGNDSV